MSVELTLTHQEGDVFAGCQGQQQTGPTPIEMLFPITDEENPYRYDPVGLGHTLLWKRGHLNN